MIIPAHLNYFNVEECGLYKHGSDVSAAFGLGETFDLIYDWVKDKPMDETIPWDPATGKSNSPRCYCHDFYKCDETGDFLFVLWKSDSVANGAVWGAQAGAHAGQSTVIEYTNEYKGKPLIWGRPCYYWVIPEINTVVSLKIEHSVCDSKLFEEWVAKCITNKIKHENKVRTTTESGQVRFEFQKDGDLGRYSYRFDVKLRSLNTGSAHMQNLAARVTHIIRRDTVILSAGTDERPGWVKIFDKVPYVTPKANAKTRQIEIRAEAKPTASEIKAIIEKFAIEEQERKRTDWNNVGFATDKGDVWVDRYRLHETVNFSKEASTVFAASEMHTRLLKNRDELLKGVVRDNALADATEQAKEAL